MVADDRKPMDPHGPGPKPECLFLQRLLALEREIDKLAELVRVYKKEFNKLKPRMYRKTK